MRPKTVLLVEDNDDNREIYATLLEHHGYAVLEAADGDEGLRVAREQQPDAILLDISIPRLDGWTVVRLLKEGDATAHIPVIALTAHALHTDRKRAADAGFDGYLPKPVEPRVVVEEVRQLIGPAQA